MRSATRRDFYASPADRRVDGRAATSRVVLVLFLLLGGLLSVLYVRQTDDLATTGYDVAALQGEESQWAMRNEQLRLQIAQLSSLDRVDQVASTRLGMGPPRRVIYVVATPVALPTITSPAAASTPRPAGLSLGSLIRALARSP